MGCPHFLFVRKIFGNSAILIQSKLPVGSVKDMDGVSARGPEWSGNSVLGFCGVRWPARRCGTFRDITEIWTTEKLINNHSLFSIANVLTQILWNNQGRKQLLVFCANFIYRIIFQHKVSGLQSLWGKFRV